MTPRLSHSLIRTLARCLLALMLFMQMMVAAHACGDGGHDEGQSPAPTISGPKHQSCHGMADVALDETAPTAQGHESHHSSAMAGSEAPLQDGQSNLCSVHCASNAQSADTYQVPALAVPLLPVLTILLPEDAADTAHTLVADAGPALPIPIPIVFGVLRC